jgi:LmbE family N-acetylglucosaminyl deacetylase
LVPRSGPGFAGVVAKAAALLKSLSPAVLVIPSSLDRHGDHQALSAIWRDAIVRTMFCGRVFEYLVWPPAILVGLEQRLELDISTVRFLKRRALAAHRSQLGLVVTDDPAGFMLPRALLARATQSQEFYFERAG